MVNINNAHAAPSTGSVLAEVEHGRFQRRTCLSSPPFLPFLCLSFPHPLSLSVCPGPWRHRAALAPVVTERCDLSAVIGGAAVVGFLQERSILQRWKDSRGRGEGGLAGGGDWGDSSPGSYSFTRSGVRPRFLIWEESSGRVGHTRVPGTRADPAKILITHLVNYQLGASELSLMLAFHYSHIKDYRKCQRLNSQDVM